MWTMPCLNLSNDMLDLIKVALTGANAKARKHHDSSGDVKAANLDCTLEWSNEGLVELNAIIIKQFRGVQFYLSKLTAVLFKKQFWHLPKEVNMVLVFSNFIWTSHVSTDHDSCFTSRAKDPGQTTLLTPMLVAESWWDSTPATYIQSSFFLIAAQWRG